MNIINLPTEIIHHILSFLLKEDISFVKLIHFYSTCRKFHDDHYIKKMIYESYIYKKIQHDINLGFNLAFGNSYSNYKKLFYHQDKYTYYHKCDHCLKKLNYNETTITTYDMNLPADYYPLFWYYNKCKRNKIFFDMTFGIWRFPIGIRLGILKACNFHNIREDWYYHR